MRYRVEREEGEEDRRERTRNDVVRVRNYIENKDTVNNENK